MLFARTICSLVAGSLKEFRDVVCEHNLQYGGQVSHNKFSILDRKVLFALESPDLPGSQ